MQGRRGENDDVTALGRLAVGPLGRWAVREHFVSGAYTESTCPIVFKFYT